MFSFHPLKVGKKERKKTCRNKPPPVPWLSNCCFLPERNNQPIKERKVSKFCFFSLCRDWWPPFGSWRQKHARGFWVLYSAITFFFVFLFNVVLDELYCREQSRLGISFLTANIRSCVVTFRVKDQGGTIEPKVCWLCPKGGGSVSWRFDLFCFVWIGYPLLRVNHRLNVTRQLKPGKRKQSNLTFAYLLVPHGSCLIDWYCRVNPVKTWPFLHAAAPCLSLAKRVSLFFFSCLFYFPHFCWYACAPF